MKYSLLYFAMVYVVGCADDVSDHGDIHTIIQRIERALIWPITLTGWFRSGNVRLHRMLNILWCLLIAGWLLSLIADHL